MKLTLLGTGTPAPDLVRRGASQVLELGDSLLLVDCGRGTVDRFVEAGYVEPGGRVLTRRLETIALTHLHSDHVTGLADLLWAGWVMRWWDHPPRLVGPPGSAHMLHHLMAAYSYDIDVRTRGGTLQRQALVPDVVEIDAGWTERTDGWHLRAFRVDHAPVDQAFGFRIDADAGSVVISGDTRYSDNLIQHAQRADILVHEVFSRVGMARRRDLAPPGLGVHVDKVASYHTPADDVGKIALATGARHLVLSHVLLGAGGSPDDILSDVRLAYDGPATVGSDLQSFTPAQ